MSPGGGYMTQINLMTQLKPQAMTTSRARASFKTVKTFWLWAAAISLFTLVGMIAYADECQDITNRGVADSRFRYTCISDCGNSDKRVLYVEDRLDHGARGRSVGRVVVIDKRQSITKDFIKSDVFPGNFWGYKKYSETGAALECSMNTGRSMGHYGDRIHSSLKRDLTCIDGKVTVNPRQQDGNSDIVGLDLSQVKKASIKGQCKINDKKELDLKIKVSKKDRKVRKSPETRTEYLSEISGFGGYASCQSIDSDLALKVGQTVFRRDARICNFNPSGLSRNSDEQGTYLEAGYSGPYSTSPSGRAAAVAARAATDPSTLGGGQQESFLPGMQSIIEP